MGVEVEMTMVCKQVGEGYKPLALVFGNIFIIVTILIVFGFAIFFSRKLQFFLIKERAPMLALAQTIIFLSTIFVPYIAEILGYSGVDITKIGILRRPLKALYIVSRQLAYMIFVLRYAPIIQSAGGVLQLESEQAAEEKEQVLAIHGQ